MHKMLSIILALAVLLGAACSPENQSMSGTASISVTVEDNTAKTISPDGNVDITHYIITAINEAEGIAEESEMLSRGESFTVTNVPAGIWKAEVDAYIQRGTEYVYVATAASEEIRVPADSTVTIPVSLEELLDEASGDITLAIMMPAELDDEGDSFHYTYTIQGTGQRAEYSYETESPLAGSTGTGGAAEISIKADAIGLLQGSYLLTVTVFDGETEAASNVVRTAVDAMRLIVGTAASGTLDMRSQQLTEFRISITDSIGDIIEPSIVDGKDSYKIEATGTSTSFTLEFEEALDASWSIEWYLDGSVIKAVADGNSYEFSIPKGKHSVIGIVQDEAMAMSVGSVEFDIEAEAEIMFGQKVTVDYADVIRNYSIPAEHVNFGFNDKEGKYVRFPYTSEFIDSDGDGIMDPEEIGLTPIDYPYVDNDITYVDIRNNTIWEFDIPSAAQGFNPNSSEIYIAFAEGPTDLGETLSNNLEYGGGGTTYRYSNLVIVFPSSIKRVGYNAIGVQGFSSDQDWIFRSEPEIDIPTDYTGSHIIMLNSYVESIEFTEGSSYSYNNGVLLKNKTELLGLSRHMAYDGVFNYLVNGNEFILPDGLTRIWSGSLNGLSAIESDSGKEINFIRLPDSIKRVDARPLYRLERNIEAIILNEGLEYLGPLSNGSWSLSNKQGFKLYIPTTIQTIEKSSNGHMFDHAQGIPEIYVDMTEEEFIWEEAFALQSNREEIEHPDIYYKGEWTWGEDGLPYANKLKSPDDDIRMTSMTTGDYALIFDRYYGHNQYKYTYTIDGTEPAEPTAESPSLNPDWINRNAWGLLYMDLIDVVEEETWNQDTDPFSMKIKVFHEGSEPSDSIRRTLRT